VWEYDKRVIIACILITAGAIIGIPILLYEFKWEVNERGVIFSQDGVPHCPYCYRVVAPHLGYCFNCKYHFRWRNYEQVCWACKGTGRCALCGGKGNLIFSVAEGASSVRCPHCWSEERNLGYCPECHGTGWLSYGNAPIPIPSLTRKRVNDLRVVAQSRMSVLPPEEAEEEEVGEEGGGE